MSTQIPTTLSQETTTNLGIAWTFTTGKVLDNRCWAATGYGTYNNVSYTFIADQVSAANGATILGSIDGITYYTVAFWAVVANTPLTLSVPATVLFYKPGYTNGGVAQGVFKIFGWLTF